MRPTTPRATRRTASAAALLAVGSLALAACGQDTSPAGGSTSSAGDDVLKAVVLLTYTTPPDPDVNYDGPGLNIIENTYEGLVAYEDGAETATLVPELATSWDVSEDGLVYTFSLREGVTFHDGTPFDSAAVAASISRRTAVDAGPAFMVADVADVATPDATTAVITLTEPNNAFLDYLASPFGVKMVSPTVLAAHPDDHAQAYLTTADAGTGPYELASAETGELYRLTAYDGYWGDAPAISTVELRIAENASSALLQLERGEIDAILGNVNKQSFESYEGSTSVLTSTFPNFTTQMIYVNPASSLAPTAEERAHLFSGIDKAGIIDAAMGSLEVPTDQLFPQGMVDGSVDDQGITYDPEAFTRLAATTDETVSIAYAGSSADGKAVAEELAARMSSAGLTAEAVAYSAGTIYSVADLGADGPDLAVFSVFPDAGHPDAWAGIIYTPSGGLDLFAAEVDGLGDLLGAARRAEDPATAYTEVADAVNASRYWYSIGSLNSTLLSVPGLTGISEAQNLLEYNVLHFAALSRS